VVAVVIEPDPSKYRPVTVVNECECPRAKLPPCATPPAIPAAHLTHSFFVRPRLACVDAVLSGAPGRADGG